MLPVLEEPFSETLLNSSIVFQSNRLKLKSNLIKLFHLMMKLVVCLIHRAPQVSYSPSSKLKEWGKCSSLPPSQRTTEPLQLSDHPQHNLSALLALRWIYGIQWWKRKADISYWTKETSILLSRTCPYPLFLVRSVKFWCYLLVDSWHIMWTKEVLLVMNVSRPVPSYVQVCYKTVLKFSYSHTIKTSLGPCLIVCAVDHRIGFVVCKLLNPWVRPGP